MFVIVQEGLFLYTHGVSPYDGGIFHQVSTSVAPPTIQGTDDFPLGTFTSSAICPTSEPFELPSCDSSPLHRHRPPELQRTHANSTEWRICIVAAVYFTQKRYTMDYDGYRCCVSWGSTWQRGCETESYQLGTCSIHSQLRLV